MPRNLLSALASLLSVVALLAYLSAGCSSPSDPPPYEPPASVGTCTLVPSPSNCTDLASQADPTLPAAKQVTEYDCPANAPTPDAMKAAVTVGSCADRSDIFHAPAGAIFCCSY